MITSDLACSLFVTTSEPPGMNCSTLSSRCIEPQTMFSGKSIVFLAEPVARFASAKPIIPVHHKLQPRPMGAITGVATVFYRQVYRISSWTAGPDGAAARGEWTDASSTPKGCALLQNAMLRGCREAGARGR